MNENTIEDSWGSIVCSVKVSYVKFFSLPQWLWIMVHWLSWLLDNIGVYWSFLVGYASSLVLLDLAHVC